jgi:hypothetical protein
MKFAPYNRIGGKDILEMSSFYSFFWDFGGGSLFLLVIAYIDSIIPFYYDSFKITYDNTLMQTLLIKSITDAL